MFAAAVFLVFMFQTGAFSGTSPAQMQGYHSDHSDGGGGGPRLPTLPKCKSKEQCGI